MTPAAKLHAIERTLERISATQHALEKKKASLRSEALRLRVSLSQADADEYASLTWMQGMTKERV
ncbi:MAG TPA: hypothetical protein VEA38_15210 [Terriglobales bacterium]|nr:hypothetical protein [Terriglobales bacterium]